MTRIRYLLPLGLVGACGVDEPADSDETLELPSFRSASGERLPGDAPGGSPADLPASCLTRYDFSSRLVPDVECRRTAVGGAPDHFVVTCPEHPQLPTTVEVERAADGRLLRDQVIFTPAGHSQPFSASVYQYDEAQKLAAISSDFDEDGIPNWRRAILSRDADGLPLTEEIRADPWALDRVYPVTAHQLLTSRYDDRGRLVSTQQRFAETGAVFSELTVTYNDRARRREWRVVIDLSSLSPQAGGPGVNRGYELFDARGALIERSWTKPDGDRSVEHYRYDRDGRQILKAFQGSGNTSYVAREVYRCP